MALGVKAITWEQIKELLVNRMEPTQQQPILICDGAWLNLM